MTGCYETFTPELTQEPVLCLNSIIRPGEPIDVKVTHTWIYSDYEKIKDHSVNDAQIRIYVNGVEVDPAYLPKEGDKIKIYAKSEKYGEAEAEVSIPFQPVVKNIQYAIIPVTQTNAPDEEYPINTSLVFNLEVKAEISDYGETEDFYSISFHDYFFESSYSEQTKERVEGEENDILRFYGGWLDYNAEPLFFENVEEMESIYGSAIGFSFFTDKKFSGSTYILNLHFSSCEYFVKSKDLNLEIVNCGKDLNIHSVSKSYYNFEYYDHYVPYGVLGNISDLGYIDPIWGYSNVSTGAGVVAAESAVNIKVSFKDELEKILF